MEIPKNLTWVKTILYFEIITTVAIAGIVAANVFHPGSGIDMPLLHKADISQYEHTTEEVQSQSHGLGTNDLVADSIEHL